MSLNPQVDQYLEEGCMRCELGGTPECKVHSFPEELRQLRMIVLDSGLTEERKWGVPCYTWDGNNVLTVSALKDAAVLGFFKGALLKDEKGLMTKPGPNSQAVRQFKFSSVAQILELEPILKAYIQEAIEVEKSGLKIDFSAKHDLEYPEELIEMLEKDPPLKSAFEELTPGRQRGYILFFSSAKQSKTRIARIEKCIPEILNGRGMHDEYRMRR